MLVCLWNGTESVIWSSKDNVASTNLPKSRKCFLTEEEVVEEEEEEEEEERHFIDICSG